MVSLWTFVPSASLRFRTCIVTHSTLENVQKRDLIDSTRKISPLTKADDAVEFDNSDMGLEEQFERIHNFTLRIIQDKK